MQLCSRRLRFSPACQFSFARHCHLSTTPIISRACTSFPRCHIWKACKIIMRSHGGLFPIWRWISSCRSRALDAARLGGQGVCRCDPVSDVRRRGGPSPRSFREVVGLAASRVSAGLRPSLLWGFVNYLFGVGVSLFALASWIALRFRPRLRFPAAAIFALVLFFCHLLHSGFMA